MKAYPLATVGFHKQGRPRGVKPDRHVHVHAHAPAQHDLEVLEVEGHICRLVSAVLVADEGCLCVDLNLGVQRSLSLPCHAGHSLDIPSSNEPGRNVCHGFDAKVDLP